MLSQGALTVPEEILVKIVAAAQNPTDWFVLPAARMAPWWYVFRRC